MVAVARRDASGDHDIGFPRVLDSGPTGGVQLDIVPWSADVYVDGVRAGRVEDFRGYYHHLELPAGPHVIAIFKPGAEPLVADHRDRPWSNADVSRQPSLVVASLVVASFR